MQRKKHLFIYKNGSRGDFLASILIGNVLEVHATDPFILHVGALRNVHYKTHDLNTPAWHLDEQIEIKSYDDYDVIIRIKLETISDCKQALKLATIKLGDRGFVSSVDEYVKHEQDYAALDHVMDKIVPFQDLFNIDKLKELFFEFRGREMTPEEEQRIATNIQINLDLLSKPL